MSVGDVGEITETQSSEEEIITGSIQAWESFQMRRIPKMEKILTCPEFCGILDRCRKAADFLGLRARFHMKDQDGKLLK